MAKKKSTLKPVSKETPKPQFQLPELRPDEVPICLTALEEIREVQDSLNSLIKVFGLGPAQGLHHAAAILRPINEKLASILCNDFPDLDDVRSYLVKHGVSIRG